MKKRIRVLRIITRLPLGGIEKRLVSVLPRLNDEEFETSICCIKEREVLADELERRGVAVYLVPTTSRLSPMSIRRLAKFMKEHRFDIVHSHMYRSNVPATIAARMAHVPVVIAQVHNVDTWESSRQRFVDSFLCRWRDAVIAVSNSVKQDILNNLSIVPQKCEVIYNGVEVERFSGDFDRSAIRKSLGIPEGNIVISIIARLVAQKNHRGFLEVAQKVAKQFENVTFLIVGGGGLKDELIDYAATLGIGDRVMFTGKRNDIPEILFATDISLLLSFKEGFSNTIMESLASGVPVIASNVGGNAEAIEDGKTGFIVDPNDTELAADKVVSLIENKRLRDEMKIECRTAARRFSIDVMVEQTKNLYRRLYSEKTK